MRLIGFSWELLSGTVELYDENGDKIFDYEGEYKLDEEQCVLIYWDDGERCEFWYEGCTIKATRD